MRISARCSLSFAAALTAFIALFALYSGCAIPVMELEHTARIDTTYAELGAIRIVEFQDERPQSEMEEDKTATNSLSAQVWSGETNPHMMVHFQNVLSEEARRTNLFTLSDPAEYQLSGEVYSMKVERKATIVRYLSILPLLGGILASDPDDQTLLWAGLVGSLVVGALEFPELIATVKYRAVLTRNGAPVLEKEIAVNQKKRYWGYSEWGWNSVSEKAGTFLDETITQSVANLFHDIEEELNGNAN